MSDSHGAVLTVSKSRVPASVCIEASRDNDNDNDDELFFGVTCFRRRVWPKLMLCNAYMPL